MSSPKKNKWLKELERLKSKPGVKFLQKMAISSVMRKMDLEWQQILTDEQNLRFAYREACERGKKDWFLEACAEEGVVTTSIRLEVGNSPKGSLLSEIAKL